METKRKNEKHRILKKLGIVLLILVLIPIIWFGRYRFYNAQTHGFVDLMTPQNLEGYTDKLFYTHGDTIKLFVRANADSNTATIRQMVGFYNTIEVKTTSFNSIEQKLNEKQSEFGCNWSNPILIIVDSSFDKGYYNIELRSKMDNSFVIYFIIGDNKNDGEIAYIAGVSTMTAYNCWGGKSLYKNNLDDKNVYYSSTLRPNIAYKKDHLTEIEANGYYWLKQRYNVDVYPDYILEQNPKILENKKVIVLPYHSEYFTSDMYNNLENLIYSGVTLLSLGANQIYWKVKWKNNYTVMECRKDLTFFDDSFLEYGGMWRHRLKPPERFLGARYTRQGMHTYAPYKVTNPTHWLYKGLDVKNGDVFGERGVDNVAISGGETDKMSYFTPDGFEIIAKGMNPAEAPVENVYYPDKQYTWNSEGGGDFIYKKLSDTNAILNSAAIHSVSGLGSDKVFTTIVSNFLNRYIK